MEPNKCGRRRSIVRRIGSFLNLRPAPRIICTPESNAMTTSKDDFLCGGSTSDANDNACLLLRICVLEQEIVDLKCAVDKIQIQTCGLTTKNMEEAACQVDQTDLLSSLQSTAKASVQPPLPPPPPPIPPPLPSLPSSSHTPSLTEVTKHFASSIDKGCICPGNRQSFGDIIKDLENVKLRHIERTATGSPVRHVPSPTGISAVLISALKKRYAAFHLKTPEKNLDEEKQKIEDTSHELF